MSEYSEKQKLLKSQATQILEDLDLIKFLSKFGKVEMVGSYPLDLMSWRDIDMEVVQQEPSYENFLETTEYLFRKEKVYSIHIQDYQKSVSADRPQGLYLGFRYLFDRSKGWDEMWKVDLWFLPPTQLYSVERRDYVKSKLNDGNRKAILTIKNEMRDKTEHGKQVSGADVYTAVLDHGVKDLEGFRVYLKELGRDL